MDVDSANPRSAGQEHLALLSKALPLLDVARIESWGRTVAALLRSGHRLLAAGNGGSAAEVQHLTAELVGRFGDERQPLSAIALHTDTSTVTAVGNDYGFDEVFARQVRAHGRPGDVLLSLSVSGRSSNVCRAATVARECGMLSWALTGPAPNPLAQLSDEAITVLADAASTVQEVHLVAIHVMCAAIDAALGLDRSGEVRPRPRAVTTMPRSTAVSPASRRLSDPVRLVVVGDALLDYDRSGSVERLSPEAPVPVVGDMAVTSRPGGAGLAALLAARGGNHVTLVTALARDRSGEVLRALLEAGGVHVVDLGLYGPTPVKTRIRADGRTLLMLDGADPVPAVVGALPNAAREALAAASGILVSDYGRGVAGGDDVRAALSGVGSSTPMVWDPHPRGCVPVNGVCVATPSSREAARFVPEAAGKGLAADIGIARALLRRWPVAQVAITRGRCGAVLVQDQHTAPLVVNAPMVSESDSCGAGDQFAAAATALLAAGALPSEAVTRAVALASAYVSAGGPAAAVAGTVPTRPESSPADPVALAARVRSGGGTVVVAGGCFDLLHTGHVQMLDEARRLGDCLIVCLNSDASVSRLKGPGRPVVAATDRRAMLLALRSVDSVLLFEEDTPENALVRLRPDVFVKGSDYAMAEIPESAILQTWGGQVVTVPYLAGRSTTALIRHAAHDAH